MFAVASAIALAFVSSALAQPNPLTPLAAEAGQPCTITWTADPTGQWTQTNIQLMSGDNQNMVPVTTVTTVDTTSGAPATFTWTCPEVTLYAPIFFYQFSQAAQPDDLIWTTRWAIESPSGQTVAAPNPTQPGGDAVPWGTAQLVDLSQVKPPPAYITGQSAPAANGTVSVTASASLPTTTSIPSSIVTVTMASAASTPSASSAASTPASAGGSTSGAALTRSQASIIAGVVGAALAAILTLA